MHFGAAHAFAEARPAIAQAAQSYASRIDEMRRIGNLAAQAAVCPLHHLGKQRCKHDVGSKCIGVAKRRSSGRRRSQVVKPPGVALQASDKLPQARSPRQLPINQGHKLVLGRQPPHPEVRPVLINQPVKNGPRHVL